ncbi:MIP/aquaporin family protein [Gryllotalpicola ginsengisoli]|uniref:MIP/aquaporin family protein n=1 Tax=Gryllotalpicola ginsengisoli TaxID=444608 RepID=UPI0003B4C0F7|nr:MIP/aquaporin family protein [Gryllotalpicola ginsengisoli]
MDENLSAPPPGHAEPEVPQWPVTPPPSRSILAGLTGELILEMFGSLIVAVFGTGVVAQVVTSKSGLGGHDSIAWSWGFGVMLGILVAGKVTGAHLNPAVTITMAVFRGFSWAKVGPYIGAQVVGWFLGALIIRIDYWNPIKALDPKLSYTSQGIFSTLPGNGDNGLNVTQGIAFVDQMIGTAVLLFLIMVITDPRNTNPSLVMVSILVGLVIVVIGMALGTDAGYAINPARDFGPRLMEWFTGYKTAWTDQHGAPYFWVPILGPIVGGLVGGLVYQFTCGLTLAKTIGDEKLD